MNNSNAPSIPFGVLNLSEREREYLDKALTFTSFTATKFKGVMRLDLPETRMPLCVFMETKKKRMQANRIFHFTSGAGYSDSSTYYGW